MLCCLNGAQPPHWVPDSHSLCCGLCGNTFSMLLRRHHCRCCGGVFCESCSSGRTSLAGWGVEQPARVCDECHRFETKQLPVLLAGDVWRQSADWTGRRHQRYLRLAYDQGTLVWARWRADEGADDTSERSADIAQLTCVHAATDATRPALKVQLDTQETLTFETSSAETANQWAAALARLVAILKQRHSYERLYGGTNGDFSPRAVLVSSERLRVLLQQRQTALTTSRQLCLLKKKRPPNATTASLSSLKQHCREPSPGTGTGTAGGSGSGGGAGTGCASGSNGNSPRVASTTSGSSAQAFAGMAALLHATFTPRGTAPGAQAFDPRAFERHGHGGADATAAPDGQPTADELLANSRALHNRMRQKYNMAPPGSRSLDSSLLPQQRHDLERS